MKTISAIQEENMIELLELIKENPTFQILPMVATECVPSDDFAWQSGGRQK